MERTNIVLFKIVKFAKNMVLKIFHLFCQPFKMEICRMAAELKPTIIGPFCFFNFVLSQIDLIT